MNIELQNMNRVQHIEPEKLSRDWSAACNAMRRLLMVFFSTFDLYLGFLLREHRLSS